MNNVNNLPVSNDAIAKDPVRKLRAWQRFHIRLTMLYGGATLIALSLLGLNVYHTRVNTELGALQKRLLSTVASLAAGIDADAINAIAIDSKKLTPLHKKLQTRFRTVADYDTDIATIYILRSTSEPTKLRFFVDYVKSGEAGLPGDSYDASEVPVMLKGFAHPAVEAQPYADEFGLTLSGYAPITTAEGKSIAVVGVDVNVAHLNSIKYNVLMDVGMAFGIAIFILSIVSLFVAKNVRTPLTKIIDASTAISRGDLKTRIGLNRLDELGLMGRHIDHMAEQLQEREFLRETFGRYMSEDIAKELLDTKNNPAITGEERVVTVLFCDLEGYSSISEQMPPAQIVNMLNRYLSAMTEVVEKHHGCVIEFIGDAVFAVFGAPHYIAEHAEQAVNCASDMRIRLKALNNELQETDIARYWKNNNKSGLNIRIGIHTGRVVAGNLGSTTRMKYAVIGDTVNVAARLEALNKELNTDTLLSRDVFTQLPEELTQNMINHGEQNIRGREQSIQVYSPNTRTKKPKLAVLESVSQT